MLLRRSASGKYFPSRPSRCQLSACSAPFASMKSPSASASPPQSQGFSAPQAEPSGQASGEAVGQILGEAASQLAGDVLVEGVDSQPRPQSLREKVYRGAAWSTVASILTQGLNLGRSMALTRVLDKHEFGLAALLFTVIGALGLLTNLGMGAVILTQRFEDEDELHRYMNTAWSFEIARNAAFSLLLCAASFPVARFMGQPSLGPLLLASSVAPLIYSLHNIGLSLYQREVNIVKTTQFDLCCGVVSVALSVAMVLWLRSAWGVVIANFFFAIFLVAFSYRFHPYRPRLCFDRAAFKVGFRFGQSVFVGGLMAYIATTADNLVVGKMLGTETLAIYAVAFSAATLPQRLVQGFLSTLLFPSFAAASRSGGGQIEAIVSRAFVLGCVLLTLLVMPLLLLSREIISILYGPGYDAAAPLLSVILVGILFRSLAQILGNLADGLGRPEINAKASTVEAAAFVLLLALLTARFGAMGAAWAGALAYSFSFVLRSLWCRSLVPRAIGELPRTFALCLLSAGAGWGAGVFVLSLPALLESNSWARGLIGASISLPVAVVMLAIFFPSLGQESRQVGAMLRKKAAR